MQTCSRTVNDYLAHLAELTWLHNSNAVNSVQWVNVKLLHLAPPAPSALYSLHRFLPLIHSNVYFTLSPIGWLVQSLQQCRSQCSHVQIRNVLSNLRPLTSLLLIYNHIRGSQCSHTQIWIVLSNLRQTGRQTYTEIPIYPGYNVAH